MVSAPWNYNSAFSYTKKQFYPEVKTTHKRSSFINFALIRFHSFLCLHLVILNYFDWFRNNLVARIWVVMLCSNEWGGKIIANGESVKISKNNVACVRVYTSTRMKRLKKTTFRQYWLLASQHSNQVPPKFNSGMLLLQQFTRSQPS
jgi:hypothetical protein